ncbi:transmembrane protein, putative (macronuclear) [Tetrahymena thermophila SB210]|uniref:Transmembrane protein, putative n=1 Tax=Tetrahymena thermophila (strain SB210) TaxID=312017 RepID=I7MGI1_TETTS|nr:transmembrane protein, putative [Tetrahymena thermophila SB210]EAR85187.1 transmembrane protein, putative [Tetrahymena thermophila SB210]|eukprot:XP_001032850.1 transmembrane protein, putative [Tetrahymena thermophila SB210]
MKYFKKIKLGLILLNSILVLAQASLTNLPSLLYQTSYSSQYEDISITEKQTVKISPVGSSLEYIKLNLTENNFQIPFCQTFDRHINLETFSQLQIQLPTFDNNGFAIAQVAFTQSWATLNPVSAFNNANIAHLDSNQTLRFIKIDPVSNTTTVVGKYRLEKLYLPDGVFPFNNVQMVQVGNYLLMAIEGLSNRINFIYIYNNQTYFYPKSLSNIVMNTDNGSLQEMQAVQIDNGDFVLFVLQDLSMSAFYLNSNFTTIKPLTVPSITQGQPQKQYGDLRIWYDTYKKQINIYILCEINGIFKYFYQYVGALAASVQIDTSFYIKVINAKLFNTYKDRQFFVTTSSDLYETREYEMVIGGSGTYYLNRVHQVDHKIRDIIVNDYYFILLGSNSNTITWHSVHPSLIYDMTKMQSYFLLLGLQGGSILQIFNSTSNQTDSYFVGIQKFHIYVTKLVPSSAYVVCSPSQNDYDTTGDHKIKLGFIYQSWQYYNSYNLTQFFMERDLIINKVYADKLTAGVIAAIVISVLVVVLGIIICICIKIKRQRAYKYTLQKELDTLKNSKITHHHPLKQEMVTANDQSPNNMIQRQGSHLPLAATQSQFSQKNSNLVRKESNVQQQNQEQIAEDVQIIKFDEDDE